MSKKKLRFGYAFWGFLADRKFENGVEVSTPDGNASYSWSILWEAQKRGWETWLLQRDRDAEYVNGRFHNAFDSFSTLPRYASWLRAHKTITTGDIELVGLDELPHLDVVLIEWRFPIPGRNIKISHDDPMYQPDLARQIQLLEHFKKQGTKIILWDLDHKLSTADEKIWEPNAIFETSVSPLHLTMKRTRIEPPIIIDELLQFPTIPALPSRKLVYVGSRYERDDVIDEWLRPVSETFPFQIEFWGNWTRPETLEECRKIWPLILYNRRITISDFRTVYGSAVACPLLGKSSYLDNGFITPRPWEALLFGTIPIGLISHYGIHDYTMFVAEDSYDMCEIVEYLSTISVERRDQLRRENVEKISFMDVKYFVDKIERIA